MNYQTYYTTTGTYTGTYTITTNNTSNYPYNSVPYKDWTLTQKDLENQMQKSIEVLELAEGKECPRCDQITTKWTDDDYLCDECRGY